MQVYNQLQRLLVYLTPSLYKKYVQHKSFDLIHFLRNS